MFSQRISFENLDDVRRAVDPVVFDKAVSSTIRQLSDKAEVQVARAVMARYPIKRATIKEAVTKYYDNSESIPARILRYVSSRISLRHFVTRARPVIKTSRGRRIGVKIKLRKDRPPKLKQGAFYAKSSTSDVKQVFTRKKGEINPATKKEKLRKRTGPAVSQLVGSSRVTETVADFVRQNADGLLGKNLDHFQKRKIGVR